MTQSFFLREFIEEILRTRGAARAGIDPAPTRESLEQEFKAAALRAAVAVFGEATPIEVRLGAELGDVCFFQVLCAQERPTEPAREIPLAALRQLGEEFADFESGDELLLPIYYTAHRGEAEQAGRLQAQLGELVPLPFHSDALWERLTMELNAALLRYFPAPALARGSLGEMLASGGGWARGLCVHSGDVEIRVQGAFLDFYRTRVSSGWVEYGLETSFFRGGVEVFRGGRGPATGRLGDGEQAPYLESLRRGDNDGSVQIWAALPTSEQARPAFIAALQEIADGLVTGRSTNAYTDSHALLVAAIQPPVEGGFWTWTREAMERLLTGHVCTIEHEGRGVRFEIAGVYPPCAGLTCFGDAAVLVVASTDDPELVPNPEGETLAAGAVGPAALSLRGPDGESEREDLERIIHTYREWLDVHLAHHVATRGVTDIAGSFYFYAFDGYFPLVQLLEQRLLWGPPGEPPVPPFDEPALARAARVVGPVTAARRREVLAASRGARQESSDERSHATLAAAGWTVEAGEREAEAGDARIFAMFAAQGWTIVLRDDLAGAPFGSYCGIDLVPPEGGAAVSVMMVDAWNPQTRTVIDGDAFAFRRFVAWLRAAVLRGGHDEVRTFAPAAEDEDEDEEDAVEITISDWLLFGMPDTGERFLVDWRAQWHIVNAVGGSDGFAGIYGFTGAYLEKLRGHDVPQWRRFLREVIDPRFAGASSA